MVSNVCLLSSPVKLASCHHLGSQTPSLSRSFSASNSLTWPISPRPSIDHNYQTAILCPFVSWQLMSSCCSWSSTRILLDHFVGGLTEPAKTTLSVFERWMMVCAYSTPSQNHYILLAMIIFYLLKGLSIIGNCPNRKREIFPPSKLTCSRNHTS